MGEALVEELKQEIAAKRAVVICGAGVSKAATGGAAPLWGDLVRLGVKRCVELKSSLRGK